MKRYPTVLTIAGSDSGGGAGIQADIKAISATGSYAASAITAVTVQNTLGVKDIFPIPPGIISAQIDAVLEDIGADAVKIGMLHDAAVVRAVKDSLQRHNIRNIVLDPVMVSTSGHRLIEEDAVAVLSGELVPIVSIITPNIPEAEILAGVKIRSAGDFPAVARRLSRSGKVSVLLKAGHLDADRLVDIFYDAATDSCIELPSPRIDTPNTHGTGCTLSSALASFLAQGFTPAEAAQRAKEYVSQAIAAGSEFSIGHGHGPVHHFFNL